MFLSSSHHHQPTIWVATRRPTCFGHPVNGFLVVLEGIDGSGKTTLAANLAAALNDEGRTVVQTREPTDGPIGARIRALARSGRESVTPEEELALFQADRKAHVEEVVRPALARGDVVIQDRSYFSTVAYQGERGLSRAEILSSSEAIAPKPDILLVVDVPVEVALQRIRQTRAEGPDAFERALTLHRIREVFLSFAEAVILDGRLSPSRLTEVALEAIASRMSTRPE